MFQIYAILQSKINHKEQLFIFIPVFSDDFPASDVACPSYIYQIIFCATGDGWGIQAIDIFNRKSVICNISCQHRCPGSSDPPSSGNGKADTGL